MSALLEVQDFGLELPVDGAMRRILRSVELEIGAGESLGLVGESGSGKSVTARSILGLFPPGARMTGDIKFDGRSVLGASAREQRRYRANDVAMIFQDPRAHINPVRRVGDHLTETLRFIEGKQRTAAHRDAVELLEAVQITDPERVFRRYPHELSGGMLQRVMIAGALASNPRLLLADEPTTALDVTTQAEVMAILGRLRADRGLAVLFVTHDLVLAAGTCDRTAVMYAGEIVERRASVALHHQPLHPYTAGLLGSRPAPDEEIRRLVAIPGQPIAAWEAPAGCSFAPRCRFAEDLCREVTPPLRRLEGGWVACHRSEEVRGELDRVPDSVSHG